MAIRIRLIWTDPNSNEDGYRIYRSLSPMAPESLPTPLATLPASSTVYLDEAVTEGEEYYYRVEAFSASGTGLSIEVAVVAEEGATADPYWALVSSLGHCNGTDGSTAFVDAKGLTWAVVGTAQIDIDESRFGGASGKFDGSARLAATSSSLVFGTGDFTIEFFVRPSSLAAGAKYFFSTDYIGSAWFTIGYSTGGFIQVGGPGGSLSGTYPPDTWYHIAITRASGVMRTFIDGVKKSEGAYPADFTHNTMFVGGASPSIAAPGNWLVGHLDEFRITKGVARYVADFTPPSSEFPES